MLTRALFLVLIICTTLQTFMMQVTSCNLQAKRLGCYKDDGNNRDLPIVENLGFKMTYPNCLIFCRSKGFNYTGLQGGAYCTCGNSFGSHGKVEDNECQSLCSGNDGQTCGGELRNEIYITGKYHIARIGCFKGEDNDKDLAQKHDAGIETTVPYCLNYCRFKGFNYTFVETSTCYCGNSYGSHVIQEDLNCNAPCNKDLFSTCGGDKHLKEIFRTFYEASTTSTTTTTTTITTTTTTTESPDDTTESPDDTYFSKTAISPAPLLVPMLVPLLVQLLVC